MYIRTILHNLSVQVQIRRSLLYTKGHHKINKKVIRLFFFTFQRRKTVERCILRFLDYWLPTHKPESFVITYYWTVENIYTPRRNIKSQLNSDNI